MQCKTVRPWIGPAIKKRPRFARGRETLTIEEFDAMLPRSLDHESMRERLRRRVDQRYQLVRQEKKS